MDLEGIPIKLTVYRSKKKEGDAVTTKELIKLIVFEYKVCTLPYFLDVMQRYELDVILDLLEFSYRLDWEQTRFLSYIVAQTQSTKHLKLSDIMSFSWDKEERDTTVTKEDVERLKNKMNQIINKK